MKPWMISAVASIMVMATALPASAQPDIREADQFWKKRVVNRISLIEKINEPLVRHESQYYSGHERFTQTEGMVMSLLEGLKAGKYVAYDHEDWQRQLSYEEVIARMQEIDAALSPTSDGWDDAPEDDFYSAPADEGWEEDSWQSEQDRGEDPNGGQQWDLSSEEDWGSPFDEAPVATTNPAPTNQMPDIGPYEQVMHVVEDYIFNKVTSRMEHRIDYFEVIWVDPSGTLPEKVLARFMWKDVREQLDLTMWKSRFNDAEARSLREVFEMRIFHAFPISVGGEPIMSLSEAERRRLEMVEFEHQLWSY